MKVSELIQALRMISENHADHQIMMAHNNKMLVPDNLVMLPHPDNPDKTAFVVLELKELDKIIKQEKESHATN